MQIPGQHLAKSSHRCRGMLCPHTGYLLPHQPLSPTAVMRCKILFRPIKKTVSFSTSAQVCVRVSPAVCQAPGTESCTTVARQCKAAIKVEKRVLAAWAPQVEDVLGDVLVYEVRSLLLYAHLLYAGDLRLHALLLRLDCLLD